MYDLISCSGGMAVYPAVNPYFRKKQIAESCLSISVGKVWTGLLKAPVGKSNPKTYRLSFLLIDIPNASLPEDLPGRTISRTAPLLPLLLMLCMFLYFAQCIYIMITMSQLVKPWENQSQ